MSKYPLVKIEDVANNLDSKRIPLNSQQRKLKESNPMYPYIGANNIMGYIDEYIFDEKIICIAEDGGSWGPLEKCSMVIDEKCWVNNHAHVLTAKDNLHLEYLSYYLNYADLNSHITGSTRGKLNKGRLNKIKIPLPPLKTQQRIAGILDGAAALRDKTAQLLTEYDLLAQSIFLEMFGDFKSSKKYPRKKLSNFLTNVSKIKNDFEEPSIEYIDISSIDNKRNLVTDSTRYLTNERPSRAQQILQKGDILYSTVRPNLKNIAIVENNNLIGSTGFAVLRTTEKLKSSYLFSLVKSDNFTNYIMSLVSGANYPAIKTSTLISTEVPVPPIELQNEFADKIGLIEQQKALAKQELQECEDLFNCLLQWAFKGELG